MTETQSFMMQPSKKKLYDATRTLGHLDDASQHLERLATTVGTNLYLLGIVWFQD